MSELKTLPVEFARELVAAAAGGRACRNVASLCRPEHWRKAVDILSGLSRVAVVSGFYVPAAEAPETDGPGGAAILARAFLEHGACAEIWTDERCVGAITACAVSIGFPAGGVKVFNDYRYLDSFAPEGIIFTERLGRAADGGYYNMRKKNITAWTSPLDDLAIKGGMKGIMTVGIGDGGNEAGMGNFMAQLGELLPDYKNCLSVVRADAALPVDVSNWGAYALAAALSHVWGEWRGHREGDERRMLEALEACGAVDGITAVPELSVDGFPLAVQEEVVSTIYNIWKKFA